MNNIGSTMKISASEEVKLYREKIVEMVEKIENENYLLKIYTFVKVFFED